MNRLQYTHIPDHRKIIVRSRPEAARDVEWLEFRIDQLQRLHVQLTDCLRQMHNSTERQMLLKHRRKTAIELCTRELQLRTISNQQ